jgi:hypothetical protein
MPCQATITALLPCTLLLPAPPAAAYAFRLFFLPPTCWKPSAAALGTGAAATAADADAGRGAAAAGAGLGA